ncbi:MAG: GDSL-type esterase/lipase family protein [Alloacidobacterium sp.]
MKLDTDKTSPGTSIVACLGSSSTAAKGSYDWIADLQARPANASVRFFNFGVGGDLAYNALARLPSVIQCRPNKIIVLIGTNDALTRASPGMRRFLGAWKRMPREPSPQWFEENLRRIAHETLSQTGARVALSSLAPIGEDLDSEHRFQQQINLVIREYSSIIRQIAAEEGTGYIPFYERLSQELRTSPIHTFTGVKILSMYRDAFRMLVLHATLDEIGLSNGWQFHTDGIHLNSRGGIILANLVQEFINS